MTGEASGSLTLRNVIQPGVCVLVKGSRAAGLEIVAEALATVPAH